ncbi:MAG: hypothetical protein H0X33_08760 [Taibaiella sp.]|nr:hypothetical protein [Taibaiella sp.]
MSDNTNDFFDKAQQQISDMQKNTPDDNNSGNNDSNDLAAGFANFEKQFSEMQAQIGNTMKHMPAFDANDPNVKTTNTVTHTVTNTQTNKTTKSNTLTNGQTASAEDNDIGSGDNDDDNDDFEDDDQDDDTSNKSGETGSKANVHEEVVTHANTQTKTFVNGKPVTHADEAIPNKSVNSGMSMHGMNAYNKMAQMPAGMLQQSVPVQQAPSKKGMSKGMKILIGVILFFALCLLVNMFQKK